MTETAPVKTGPRHAKPDPEVGQLTRDGIYIGRFAGKDGVEKDYFADPRDAQDSNGKRLALDFNEAAEYAKKSNTLGFTDWVVPTGVNDRNGAPDILGALFNNRAKIGGFTETGFYRSSSVYGFRDGSARTQNFKNGSKIGGFKAGGEFVRLVRSVPV